ncbi:alpha/beta fold hydrolase [Rhodococcus opacus]|uniref:alpha/beta fold hydrolase n=1 Tax=Rhodococcus TaxID=1827 RepID=UPI0002A2EEE8|nr:MULTISPECIES: alpha/beta hydrolase [Rhodococcus]ELB94324.1 epoxide hydrolase [Rhodococcus wratislaviensis IFP 2016]MDI9937577.1 alpha/beta hydrolase [Rhodococcus sp. IEGM 1351]MDV6242836.1 alpha/beta hydrolase [Rhodococcus opacus]MDX5968132.1 alpha/beta hydrolase [Rhodococcus opacus]NKY73303.1 alpha/beta hydrolase [Rhodococcus opacus]
MASSTERIVTVDGFRWQITELGDGPPVVLCHGFPGLGYSYRHQMRALAASGYRAIAPDMPGYGGTDVPRDIDDYTNERVSDALIGLLDSLGHERAVFVGHDFGAPVAWTVALRHRARVSGLVLLAVPYAPDRFPLRPSEIYASMARKHFLHIHYFQEPGVADRELDADPRGFLHQLFYALSGAYRYLDIWQHPSDGNGYLDVLPEAPPLPWSWLTEDEFDHYVEVFTRTGFTGGLNWYRAYDANWERSRNLAGADIEVPTLFVAGAHDPVLTMSGAQALDRMRDTVPDLRGLHLVEGAGHFVQQERPEEVNELLLTFVAGRTGDDDGDSARAGDRSTRGAR